MLNNERPVGATDDKSTIDQARVTSSPNNGNTNVVGSQSPVSHKSSINNDFKKRVNRAYYTAIVAVVLQVLLLLKFLKDALL